MFHLWCLVRSSCSALRSLFHQKGSFSLRVPRARSQILKIGAKLHALFKPYWWCMLWPIGEIINQPRTPDRPSYLRWQLEWSKQACRVKRAFVAFTVYSWNGIPKKRGTVYGKIPSKITSMGPTAMPDHPVGGRNAWWPEWQILYNSGWCRTHLCRM